MPTPASVIVYDGPSQITGRPIFMVATGFRRRSRNAKTGDMIQTYILCRDENPLTALKSGRDVDICGSCPRRNGSCYVNVARAPLTIWRAYQRGSYRQVPLPELAALCAGRVVRLGAYGDPAAVPLEVWQALLAQASSHTGYTHQWKAKRFESLKAYCQASADSTREAQLARERGWGTFRVRAPDDDAVLPDEVLCPASAEAGKVATCASCRRCAGTTGGFPQVQYVTIAAHGQRPNAPLRVPHPTH